MKDRAYRWWKNKPWSLRKPLVFAVGILLIIIAPFIGFIPGPGGILVFLLGIAVLASEFDWALSLKAFFLKTVPAEVKKRWRPTQNWEYTFDITTGCLLTSSVIFGYYDYWLLGVYCGILGTLLFIFNRSRLDRLKLYFAKRKN